MAIALVVTAEAQGGGSGTTAGVDTTGATLLVAYSVWYTGTVSITDSKGNTWTSLTTKVSTIQGQIFYAVNPTVGSGHTFSYTGGTFTSLKVLAYSGTDIVTPFDVENGGTTGGATSLSTGSVTPSSNGSLVVAGWGAGPLATAGLSINSSLTIRGTTIYGDGATYFGTGVADYVQPTAGAINPQLSWTGSEYAVAPVAVFKPAAGGAGVVKTVNGLAIASVKTVNGLAIASIKTINGAATA